MGDCILDGYDKADFTKIPLLSSASEYVEADKWS